MKKNIITVSGMHCASCSSIIEKKISKLNGVENISVNIATEQAHIDYDENKVSIDDMNREIEKLGYRFITPTPAMSSNLNEMDHSAHTGRHQSREQKQQELASMRSYVQFVLPIALMVFILMMWDIAAQLFTAIPNAPLPMSLFNTVTMVLATIVLFWAGQPFLQGVMRFIRYRVANMDTLIGIGTSVAYLYSAIITLFPQVQQTLQLPEYTYFDVTIVVIGFILLGKYLEARSKIKTGDAIEKLLGLQAKTALVIRNNIEIEIPTDQVAVGDSVVIKPGQKIPVDGVISQGSSFIDESMVTGEPMPAHRAVGDTVISGTLNTSGAFTFTASKVGSETMLAHIIKMVQDAQGSRAPIQATADKISAVFVPIVLVIAFVAFIAWLVFGTGPLGFSVALSFALSSLVGVLVIACPCALGLATPTAIIVGVGKGAHNGILLKDAASLETLHKVNVVVMDKTGTITHGKPRLTSIKNLSSKSDNEIISILATLESKSEHPIAHAITSYAREQKIDTLEMHEFNSIKGKGVSGMIGNALYLTGNAHIAIDTSIPFDISSLDAETLQGKTPVIVASRTEVLAIVMVADKVKHNSKEAVKSLHSLGIKTVMLTGDNKNTAEYIATQIGIDEVVAQVLPADKLRKIKELQSQGYIVAMIGDGVNDAPALAAANVGIAMGTGTDVAIESAGITLLHGDISKLAQAIKLSRMTMRGIRQNLFWAFIFNIVGIPLAAGLLYPMWGVTLSPVFAGMAMAFSSVLVVGNSLRLKAKKL